MEILGMLPGCYFLEGVCMILEFYVDCKALRNGDQQIFRSEIMACDLFVFLRKVIYYDIQLTAHEHAYECRRIMIVQSYMY